MPEWMKPYALSALLLLSVLYLGVQALTGQYGLLTGDERAATLADREAAALRLTEERQELELRVRYLQTDHLSRDLLEERARVLLGYADPADHVIRVSLTTPAPTQAAPAL
ncbi:septum formation initiator family protein [Brevundimonas sp.]|uniref:FtsB family cell division protein n=1 Tax=Brevundimonas sp. TaxID=1871086 RepID=UPI0025BD5CA9|nr:septum formation initiator family protein [Brevundimonas sp.]